MQESFSDNKIINEIEHQIVEIDTKRYVLSEFTNKILFLPSLLLFLGTSNSIVLVLLLVIDIIYIILSKIYIHFRLKEYEENIAILNSMIKDENNKILRDQKNELLAVETKRREEAEKRLNLIVDFLCSLEKRKNDLIATEQKRRKALDEVKTTSLCVKNLINLNNQFKFDIINDIYYFNIYCYSKQNLININFEQSLIDTLELKSEESFIKDIIEKSKLNVALWSDYCIQYKNNEKYSEISPIADMHINSYYLYENELYQKNKLKRPTTNVIFRFEAWYISAGGRNSYTLEKKFTQEEVYSIIEEKEKRKNELLDIENKRREEAEKRLKLIADLLCSLEKRKSDLIAAENKKRKEIDEVKMTSLCIKNLINLNNQFKFNKIRGVHHYKTSCHSKQNLINFNFNQSLMDTLAVAIEEFRINDIIEKAQLNAVLWSDYCIQYKNNEKYSEVSSINDISIDSYCLYEKELYQKNKLKQPTTNVIIHFQAYYTSAGGRNSYTREKNFTQEEVSSIIEEMHIVKNLKILELKEQKKAHELKLEKERKLRELEKFEQILLKKEAEIKIKEQEFQKATKGHIYSTNNTSSNIEDVNNINAYNSKLSELKNLKRLLDKGEITFEEYYTNRQKLL